MEKRNKVNFLDKVKRVTAEAAQAGKSALDAVIMKGAVYDG